MKIKAKDLKAGDKISLEVESVEYVGGSWDVVYVKFKRQDLKDRVNPEYRNITLDEDEEIDVNNRN